MLQTIVKLLLGNLIFALMLGVGLAARLSDLSDIKRRPSLYARAFLAMWIGVPLVAMAVIAIFRLPMLPAELLLIMAICPGAPFITMTTKRKGEHYSVVGLNLLVLASITAPFLIPAWILVLQRVYPYELSITVEDVVRSILPQVFIPLVVGLTISTLAPRLAKKLVRPVQYFFLAALVVALVVVAVIGLPVLLKVRFTTYLAVFVDVIAATFLGAWVAGKWREERKTLGIAVAQGNPGLGLAVIAASHPGFQASAIVVAYVLVRAVAMIPFKLWSKRRGQPPTGIPEPAAA